MNRLILLLLLVLVSISSASFARADALNMANGGPTEDQVNVVRENIGDFLHTLRGVNGSMMSACEANSGIPFFQLSEVVISASEFVNCLVVTTEEPASKDAFDVLFPAGSKFMDVYIPIWQVGKIVMEAQ